MARHLPVHCTGWNWASWTGHGRVKLGKTRTITGWNRPSSKAKLGRLGCNWVARSRAGARNQICYLDLSDSVDFVKSTVKSRETVTLSSATGRAGPRLTGVQLFSARRRAGQTRVQLSSARRRAGARNLRQAFPLPNQSGLPASLGCKHHLKPNLTLLQQKFYFECQPLTYMELKLKFWLYESTTFLAYRDMTAT